MATVNELLRGDLFQPYQGEGFAEVEALLRTKVGDGEAEPVGVWFALRRLEAPDRELLSEAARAVVDRILADAARFQVKYQALHPDVASGAVRFLEDVPGFLEQLPPLATLPTEPPQWLVDFLAKSGRTPIRRVFIPNRGDPARRAIETTELLSRILGYKIETVAMYTSDDQLPYISRADHAIFVKAPPGAPANYIAYKDPDAIFDQVINHMAQRGLPIDAADLGWGFLSEVASFTRRLEDAGIINLGPSSFTHMGVGEKTPGTDLARASGVPVVPSSPAIKVQVNKSGAKTVVTVSDSDMETAWLEAKKLGFPNNDIILKADGGGGGAGNRRIKADPAWRTNEAAAKAFFVDVVRQWVQVSQDRFGNPNVAIQKFINNGRHVEYQVVGDGTGRPEGIYVVGKRNCSAQRNDQKLLEWGDREPIDPARVIAIQKFAAAFGLKGACTVEFIQSPDGEEFFMEVNTRLQVEHLVTEENILVALNLNRYLLAMGLPPFKDFVARIGTSQALLSPNLAHLEVTARRLFEDLASKKDTLTENDKIVLHALLGIDFSDATQSAKQVSGISPRVSGIGFQNGRFSLDIRINAENPYEGFRPSPGVVRYMQVPTGTNVRVDLAVKDGSRVSSKYDTMIAKVTVFADTPEELFSNADIALEQMKIVGVDTTIEFDRELLRTSQMRATNPERTKIGVGMTIPFVGDYMVARGILANDVMAKLTDKEKPNADAIARAYFTVRGVAADEAVKSLSLADRTRFEALVADYNKQVEELEAQKRILAEADWVRYSAIKIPTLEEFVGKRKSTDKTLFAQLMGVYQAREQALLAGMPETDATEKQIKAVVTRLLGAQSGKRLLADLKLGSSPEVRAIADEYISKWLQPKPYLDEALVGAALAAYRRERFSRTTKLFDANSHVPIDGESMPASFGLNFQAEVDGRPADILVREFKSGRYLVTVNGRTIVATAEQTDPYQYRINIEADRTSGETAANFNMVIDARQGQFDVSVHGFKHQIKIASSGAAAEKGLLTAASPCSVFGIGRVNNDKDLVLIPGGAWKVGDKVQKGEVLVVTEAMKQFSGLKAPVSGTITEILVSPGRAMVAGQAIIRIKADETGEETEVVLPYEFMRNARIGRRAQLSAVNEQEVIATGHAMQQLRGDLANQAPSLATYVSDYLEGFDYTKDHIRRLLTLLSQALNPGEDVQLALGLLQNADAFAKPFAPEQEALFQDYILHAAEADYVVPKALIPALRPVLIALGLYVPLGTIEPLIDNEAAKTALKVIALARDGSLKATLGDSGLALLQDYVSNGKKPQYTMPTSLADAGRFVAAQFGLTARVVNSQLGDALGTALTNYSQRQKLFSEEYRGLLDDFLRNWKHADYEEPKELKEVLRANLAVYGVHYRLDEKIAPNETYPDYILDSVLLRLSQSWNPKDGAHRRQTVEGLLKVAGKQKVTTLAAPISHESHTRLYLRRMRDVFAGKDDAAAKVAVEILDRALEGNANDNDLIVKLDGEMAQLLGRPFVLLGQPSQDLATTAELAAIPRAFAILNEVRNYAAAFKGAQRDVPRTGYGQVSVPLVGYFGNTRTDGKLIHYLATLLGRDGQPAASRKAAEIIQQARPVATDVKDIDYYSALEKAATKLEKTRGTHAEKALNQEIAAILRYVISFSKKMAASVGGVRSALNGVSTEFDTRPVLEQIYKRADARGATPIAQGVLGAARAIAPQFHQSLVNPLVPDKYRERLLSLTANPFAGIEAKRDGMQASLSNPQFLDVSSVSHAQAKRLAEAYSRSTDVRYLQMARLDSPVDAAQVFLMKLEEKNRKGQWVPREKIVVFYEHSGSSALEIQDGRVQGAPAIEEGVIAADQIIAAYNKLGVESGKDPKDVFRDHQLFFDVLTPLQYHSDSATETPEGAYDKNILKRLAGNVGAFSLKIGMQSANFLTHPSRGADGPAFHLTVTDSNDPFVDVISTDQAFQYVDEAIAKQHARGKMTSDERAKAYFDDGVYEVITVEGADEPQVYPRGHEKAGQRVFTAEGRPVYEPSGIMIARGKVNGREVVVCLGDFRRDGGAVGRVEGRKMLATSMYARIHGLPVVWMNDSGGANIKQKVVSLNVSAEDFGGKVMTGRDVAPEDFVRWVEHHSDREFMQGLLKEFLPKGTTLIEQMKKVPRQIPHVSLMVGAAAGMVVYGPAMLSHSWMVDAPQVFCLLTGKDVVYQVYFVKRTDYQLGGAQIIAKKAGTVDGSKLTEQEVMEVSRLILDWLDQSQGSGTGKIERAPMSNGVKPSPRTVLNMDMLRANSDAGVVYSKREEVLGASAATTAYVRLGGRTVAVVGAATKDGIGSPKAVQKAYDLVQDAVVDGVPVIRVIGKQFLNDNQHRAPEAAGLRATLTEALATAKTPQIAIVTDPAGINSVAGLVGAGLRIFVRNGIATESDVWNAKKNNFIIVKDFAEAMDRAAEFVKYSSPVRGEPARVASTDSLERPLHQPSDAQIRKQTPALLGRLGLSIDSLEVESGNVRAQVHVTANAKQKLEVTIENGVLQLTNSKGGKLSVDDFLALQKLAKIDVNKVKLERTDLALLALLKANQFSLVPNTDENDKTIRVKKTIGTQTVIATVTAESSSLTIRTLDGSELQKIEKWEQAAIDALVTLEKTNPALLALLASRQFSLVPNKEADDKTIRVQKTIDGRVVQGIVTEEDGALVIRMAEIGATGQISGWKNAAIEALFQSDLQKFVQSLPGIRAVKLSNSRKAELFSLTSETFKPVTVADLIPPDLSRKMDMHAVIRALADDGEFFEVGSGTTEAESLSNQITGFMSIGGRVVGVLGDQPAIRSGAADYTEARKYADFVKYCEKNRIPILDLNDSPGFPPGELQEGGNIQRLWGEALKANILTTVPRVSLSLRRGYGGRFIIAGHKWLRPGIQVVVGEGGEIAVMGARGGMSFALKAEYDAFRASVSGTLTTLTASLRREMADHPTTDLSRAIADFFEDLPSRQAEPFMTLDLIKQKLMQSHRDEMREALPAEFAQINTSFAEMDALLLKYRQKIGDPKIALQEGVVDKLTGLSGIRQILADAFDESEKTSAAAFDRDDSITTRADAKRYYARTLLQNRGFTVQTIVQDAKDSTKDLIQVDGLTGQFTVEDVLVVMGLSEHLADNAAVGQRLQSYAQATGDAKDALYLGWANASLAEEIKAHVIEHGAEVPVAAIGAGADAMIAAGRADDARSVARRMMEEAQRILGLLPPEPTSSAPVTPAADGGEVVELTSARAEAEARARDAGGVAGAGEVAGRTSQVAGDGATGPQVDTSTDRRSGGDSGGPLASAGDNLVGLDDFRLNPAAKSTTGVLEHQDILARARDQQTTLPAWSSLGHDAELPSQVASRESQDATGQGDSGGPLAQSAAHFVIEPHEERALDLSGLSDRSSGSQEEDTHTASSAHRQMAGMARRGVVGRVAGRTATGVSLRVIGR